jgi:hypothetical protein
MLTGVLLPDFLWLNSGSEAGVVPPPPPPPVVASGIYNYRTLKDYVASFLGRADLESKMDGVCDMAESRIRRLLRDRTVGPVSFLLTENAALPSDCGELRTMRYAGTRCGPYAIGVTSPSAVAIKRGMRADLPGLPETIAVVQRTILVAPLLAEPVPVEITYYQTVPPLVADTDTNWLLDDAPDVYVYGMLLHFSQYLVEDERVGMWEASFITAMKELERARERREYAALPLETLNEYSF